MTDISQILVLIDFSESADNALRYAIHLAKQFKANVILMHTYRLTSEKPMKHYVDHLSLKKELEQKTHDNFLKLEKKLLLKSGLDYEFIMEVGFVNDSIASLAKSRSVDLVIAGSKGIDSNVDVIGSTSLSIIEEIDIPVLFIPEKATYSGIENILFASDNKDIKNPVVLRSLRSFAGFLGAEVHIVNVLVKKVEYRTPSQKANIATEKLDKYFKPVKHSFHLEINEDVESGLNNYLEKNKIDIIAMMPRRQTLFDRLFNGIHTKNIALHTKIPLLTFHD